MLDVEAGKNDGLIDMRNRLNEACQDKYQRAQELKDSLKHSVRKRRRLLPNTMRRSANWRIMGKGAVHRIERKR